MESTFNEKDYLVGKKIKCVQENFYIMTETGPRHIGIGSSFKVIIRDGDKYWLRPINVKSLQLPIVQVDCSEVQDFIVCNH